MNLFICLPVWLGYAACAGVALFIAGQVTFLLLHFRLRPRGLAEEQALLSQLLPPAASLPHVAVQLPVYNEGEIIRRANAAAAALDWPRDKLHIQVCDDSTDATTQHAEAEIRTQDKNLDIKIVRRPTRDAFKAGSLRHAMSETDSEYFAIFDVDYIPPPDYLKRCMAPLLANPRLAFVQARPGFLNRDESALTKAQAMELDAHYCVEQTTRSWAELPLPFNGTCGIWRRAAIDLSGGWQGNTIAEDMELSYAAWLKGWQGLFVTSVEVPGELPADRKAWLLQQERWLVGSGQAIKPILSAIWRDGRLSPLKKLVAAMNIASWWLSVAINVAIAATAVSLVLDPGAGLVLLAVVVSLLTVLIGLLFVNLRTGNLNSGNKAPMARFVRDFASYLACEVYKLGLHAITSRKAILNSELGFNRTPKRGAQAG